MAKVIHERDKCIGCGSCVSICPEFWEMGEDGKSNLKGATQNGDNFEKEVENAGCCKEAEGACPVSCIHVEE